MSSVAQTDKPLPRLLAPQHWQLWAGCGAALINALLRVALIPSLVPPLVDEVLVGQQLAGLPRLISLASSLVLAGALALWLQDGWLGSMAARTLAQWRAGVYRYWLETTPAAGALRSGGFSGRLISDLKEIETFLQYGIGSLIAESLTLLGILAVLLWLDWRATLWLLLAFAPLLLVMMGLGRKLQQRSAATQAGLESLAASLQEGFARRHLLAIFHAQDFAHTRFAAHNQHTLQQQRQRVWLAALQTPLAQVLGFAALLVLLGRLLTNGSSLGQVMSYLSLVALLATPLQLLPRAYGYLQMAQAASSRLWQLVPPSAPAPLAPPVQPRHLPHPVRCLQLEALHFSYGEDAGKDDSILQDITVRWCAPRFVCIGGESGAGKSSLLRLLLGLHSPSRGQILLDTIPLQQLSAEQRAACMGYVPQTPQLFAASIADNLRLGQPYAEAALWQALEQVGLAEAVRALPQQLAHPLHEQDSHANLGLSVGQQQRLSLARALLRQPDILLVDEANANLDATSEAHMLACLADYAQHALVVLVSHRPIAPRYGSEAWQLSQGTLAKIPTA